MIDLRTRHCRLARAIRPFALDDRFQYALAMPLAAAGTGWRRVDDDHRS